MLATHHFGTTTIEPAIQPSPGKLRACFSAYAEGEAAGARHLLILRFAVLNLVAVALLARPG